MNFGEGPIRGRGANRGRDGHGVQRKLVVAAVACLSGSVLPAQVVAQADYTGPAVVPRADAYLEEVDGSAEPVLPRWNTGDAGPRILWTYFTNPPADRPSFWEATRRAMDAWNSVGGVPLVFRPTKNAHGAEVEFRWIRRFDASQAGTTDWETDGDGWLSSVAVTLAVEHEDGTPMGDDFLRLVALHELGHVIGLPHSGDPSDVMHPGNRNLRLSDRDIRSARRLYERLESEKVSVP